MINPDITLLVQLINFLVTLVVLNWLLITPIRKKIKERNEWVNGMGDEIEKFTDQAEEKLTKYEAALAEARAAGTQERLRLKDEAVEEEKKLVSAATSDAQDDLAKAREEIAKQSKAAMESLTSQASAMAQQAADKVLG